MDVSWTKEGVGGKTLRLGEETSRRVDLFLYRSVGRGSGGQMGTG